jgi:hypothetical protein
MRRALFAAFALAVAAVPCTAAPNFVLRSGPHFRVLCHFDDERAADAALETVEAIWPLASDLFGLSAAPLDPPLDVHLYRRPDDYLAAEREIAAGKFAKNLAFSSYETRSAYVAVQPDLTDETLAEAGITAQTRHLLAHEAAHLVRWRAAPAFRSHPGWLSDGIAMWIEEETLAARGWSAGGAEDPYVAADMIRAQRLLAGGHLPSATGILRDETKDMEMYDRYSVRKLLFRRLVTRNDAPAFRAALRAAWKLEDGKDFAARMSQTLLAPYAAEGLAGLDLDFEQFVRSQAPAWDEVFRSLSTVGDAWLQAAFPDRNAVSWRTSSVGVDTYELRGQIEILPGSGKSQQMNLLLCRADGGFVSIAFVAGYGADVFLYHSADDRWERLAAAPTKAVQLWRRIPVRVTVDGSKLTLRIDGTEVATADVKGHPMSGPWGLGVQAGAAGVWRGIRVEKAAPKAK